MNISPVSFGSTPMSFSERVSAPQRFAQKEAPVAATNLTRSNKNESSFGKKLFKFVLAAGAIAAGLALGAKKGIFKSEKMTNETLKKGLGYVQTAGEKIGEKATHYYGIVKDKISQIVKKAPEVAQNVTENPPV